MNENELVVINKELFFETTTIKRKWSVPSLTSLSIKETFGTLPKKTTDADMGARS